MAKPAVTPDWSGDRHSFTKVWPLIRCEIKSRSIWETRTSAFSATETHQLYLTGLELKRKRRWQIKSILPSFLGISMKFITLCQLACEWFPTNSRAGNVLFCSSWKWKRWSSELLACFLFPFFPVSFHFIHCAIPGIISGRAFYVKALTCGMVKTHIIQHHLYMSHAYWMSSPLCLLHFPGCVLLLLLLLLLPQESWVDDCHTLPIQPPSCRFCLPDSPEQPWSFLFNKKPSAAAVRFLIRLKEKPWR